MFEKVTSCPVCEGAKFKNQLICIDQLGSGESFVLVDCDTCGFRITNPRPDIQSISKYYPANSYAPHQGKATNIFQFAYQIAQTINSSWKNRLIKRIIPTPQSLLDYGAGTGAFLNRMKRKGWAVSGVEPNSLAREIADTNFGLKIHENDTQLPDNQLYKIITLWHVLEHIHDIENILLKLALLLEKEGRLIIAVPNYLSYDAQKYGQDWAGYDVPRHLFHFNQKTMKKFLKKCGLILEDIVPMKLDAYYVSILSEKNKQTQFSTMRGILSGLTSNRWASRNSNNYSSLVYIAKK